MAIVKKIVEDHKGELKLSDNPEGGAIIQFNLAAEPERITSEVETDPLQVEIELAMLSTRA